MDVYWVDDGSTWRRLARPWTRKELGLAQVSGCWLTLPKWPFNNLLLLGSPNNCGGVVWPGICKINSASSPSVLSLFLWFLICSTKSFASTRKLSSIFFISWAVRVFGRGCSFLLELDMRWAGRIFDFKKPKWKSWSPKGSEHRTKEACKRSLPIFVLFDRSGHPTVGAWLGRQMVYKRVSPSPMVL